MFITTRKTCMNIFSRKLANYIWISSSHNKDHGYAINFVQKPSHKQIWLKIVLHLNVQIQISPLILNETLRSKLHCNLRCEIYKTHIKISRIVFIEFWPYVDAGRDSACFAAPMRETDGVDCCRRWLGTIPQLNNAWGSEILQLPWKFKVWTVGIGSIFSSNCFKQSHTITCRWWMLQKKHKDPKILDELMKKCMWKIGEKWENLRVFALWIWEND